MIMHSNQNAHNRAIGLWLLLCAGTVYLMVVVGGITRLTQSGLSMVQWEPLMGILPPLSLAEWQHVFDLYRESPEYQKVNRGMSLAEFKGIFWWEYGHRVLGRLIGILYLLPLLYFTVRGFVPSHWRVRLWTLFLLGGLQGLMGWYMVKSGLVDIPRVSQYRLTAHLGLAFVIFALMWWFALGFLRGQEQNASASPGFKKFSAVVPFIVFLMILSGGFVAGTKAGFIINTFPTMHGQWIPSDLFAMTPWWLNLFENVVTIQFTHRLLALVVIASVLVLVAKGAKEGYRSGVIWPLAMLLLQVMLGISALVMAVPVVLGAAHQAGAVALLASVLWVAHRARFSPPRSS